MHYIALAWLTVYATASCSVSCSCICPHPTLRMHLPKFPPTRSPSFSTTLSSHFLPHTPAGLQGRAVLGHHDHGHERLEQLDVLPGAAQLQAAGRAVDMGGSTTHGTAVPRPASVRGVRFGFVCWGGNGVRRLGLGVGFWGISHMPLGDKPHAHWQWLLDLCFAAQVPTDLRQWLENLKI